LCFGNAPFCVPNVCGKKFLARKGTKKLCEHTAIFEKLEGKKTIKPHAHKPTGKRNKLILRKDLPPLASQPVNI
jgi:hypothetical protein